MSNTEAAAQAATIAEAQAEVPTAAEEVIAAEAQAEVWEAVAAADIQEEEDNLIA